MAIGVGAVTVKPIILSSLIATVRLVLLNEILEDAHVAAALMSGSINDLGIKHGAVVGVV